MDGSDYESLFNAREYDKLIHKTGNNLNTTSSIYWHFKGLYALGKINEAIKLLDEILDAEFLEKSEHAPFVHLIGHIYWKHGDRDLTVEYYKTALKLYKAIGNEEGVATALFDIGAVYRIQGEYSSALDYSNQSLDIWKKLNNKYQRARLLSTIGSILIEKSDIDEALNSLIRSLEIFEELGVPEDIARPLILIGHVYSDKGQNDQALHYYQRSLELLRKMGNLHYISIVLHNLGIIYRKTGDLNEALNYFQQSLEELKKVGDPHEVASSFANIGHIYRIRGELQRAFDYYNQSLELELKLENPRDLGAQYSHLGLIELERQNYVASFNYYKKSLELFKPIENDFLIGGILYQLTKICIIKDDVNAANKYMQELKELVSNTDKTQLFNYVKYLEGFKLKHSSRHRMQMQALDIFEELLGIIDYEFEMRIGIIKHIVELLLLEFKAGGNQEVMVEIQQHLKNLSSIIKNQNLQAEMVNLLVLQSKLAIIDRDYDTADEFLNQARFFIDKHELNHLVPWVSEEQNELHQDVMKLKHDLETSSLATQLEKTKILDYLQAAKQFNRQSETQ